MAGSSWVGPSPRLVLVLMFESPILPDQAATVQISSPVVPPCLQAPKGGAEPCTRGGQDRSSFLGPIVHPPSCSLPKVLPENKGPLRFTAGCAGQTLPLAVSSTTRPIPQTQIKAGCVGQSLLYLSALLLLPQCPSASFRSSCPACCFDTWDPNASMHPFHAHPMPLWLVLAPWQELVHAPPPPTTATGVYRPYSPLALGAGWRAPAFPPSALHSLASPPCFWLRHMGPQCICRTPTSCTSSPW